jgi:hypothetical protein
MMSAAEAPDDSDYAHRDCSWCGATTFSRGEHTCPHCGHRMDSAPPPHEHVHMEVVQNAVLHRIADSLDELIGVVRTLREEDQ